MWLALGVVSDEGRAGEMPEPHPTGARSTRVARRSSGAGVEVWGPGEGFCWVFGPQCGHGVVQCVGGVVGAGCAGGGEGGIYSVGDVWCGGVVDRPEGGDDVAIAEQLHGGGEVDRFVECSGAAGGGLAGGQER